MFSVDLFNPTHVIIRRSIFKKNGRQLYKIGFWDSKTGASFQKRGFDVEIRKYFKEFVVFNGYQVEPMYISWKTLDEGDTGKLSWRRNEDGLFEMRS